MVLAVILLVFTSLGSLQSFNELESNRFDVLERWGIQRVKRDEKTLKEKFPESGVVVCDMMHETSETPFTAIVLFRTSGRLLCMGSIVDAKHVLSAKKCYERADLNDILVLVGYYKAYWGRYSQVLKVRKIVRHEYMLALLRLNKAIKFTEYVQPVRLPPSGTKVNTDFDKVFGKTFKLVGFQVDRYDVPGDYINKQSTYSLKEDHFVAFDMCMTNYTKLILEKTKLFCTIGNATYCWGGWGAPVLKYMDEKEYFLQVGVVVADNCTADTTGPFLCARTDAFGDWIRGNSFHDHRPS